MGKITRLSKHLMETNFMGVRNRVLKEQKTKAVREENPLEQQRD